MFLFRWIICLCLSTSPLAAATLLYHPNKAHRVTVSYQFDINQRLDGRLFANSRIEGKFDGRITALSDGEEISPIRGLPDSVQICIGQWEGSCSFGDMEITYSSTPSSSGVKERKVPSPFERAAVAISGRSLEFRISRPVDNPTKLVVSASSELKKLYERHPVLKEMFPPQSFESLLQQIFAVSEVDVEAGKVTQSWLSVTNAIAAPATFLVTAVEPVVVATIEADLRESKGVAGVPIKGEFKGEGRWNLDDLLQFHTVLDADYTAVFQGGTSAPNDVHVVGRYTIEGSS